MDQVYYDLTLSQDALMVSQKYSFQKQVLNIPLTCVTERALNFDLLRQAMETAALRFDSLFLRYTTRDKKVVQYFTEPVKPEIGFIDCQGMDERKQDRILSRIARKNVHLPDRPLYRLFMFRDYRGYCGLFTCISHLIMDSWAIINFYKDIFGIYYHLEGKGEMPPAPTPFKDELLRELEYAKSEQHEKDLAWWKEEWDTHEPIYTNLVPSNRLEKARKKHKDPNFIGAVNFSLNTRGEHVIGIVDKAVADQINAYCALHKVTPAVFFELGLSGYLAQVSGTDKAAMATSVAMRSKLSQRSTGGSMLGSHFFSTEFDWNASFNDTIAKAQSRKLNIMRHYGPAYRESWEIMQKRYGLSPLEAVSSISLSFQPLPFSMGTEDVFHTFWYPNGACNQPAMIEVMDFDGTGAWRVYYEIQSVHISRPQCETIHRRLMAYFRLALEDGTRPLGRIWEEAMKVQ